MKPNKITNGITILLLIALLLPVVNASHITPSAYPYFVFEPIDTQGEKISIHGASVPIVSNPDNYPLQFYESVFKNLPVKVKIKNIGLAGKMKVECGIYKRKDINSWYAGSGIQPLAALSPGINNIDNCLSYQKTVDTIELTLGKGEQKEIKFEMTTPDVTTTDSSYGIHCASFSRCFNEATNIEDIHERIGQTDRATAPVTIYQQIFGNEDPTPPSCDDAQKNQDESDIDCGGSCEGCATGARCKSSLDCTTEYCNTQTGVCANKPQAICGNGMLEQGEDCTTCPQDAKKQAGSTCSSERICTTNGCSTDPTITPTTCGNDIVEPAENCVTCPKDVEKQTGEDCGQAITPDPKTKGYLTALWIGGTITLIIGLIILGIWAFRKKRRR